MDSISLNKNIVDANIDSVLIWFGYDDDDNIHKMLMLILTLMCYDVDDVIE